MNIMTARLLLESLLERIELDSATGKWRLGTISSQEKQALEAVVQEIGGGGGVVDANLTAGAKTSEPKVPVDTIGKIPAPADEAEAVLVDDPVLAAVVLNLRALEIVAPESPDVMLCLDFGTAMSKAFAMQGESTPVELALGTRAGSTGNPYPVESSLFISDEGLVFFGPQAVSKGTDAAEAGRVRFDSPKARLSMGGQGEIDKIKVGQEINPTDTPMSEGEMITLYLGYLTDLAVTELESRGHSRYTKRRFARPCWPEERNRWAEPLLRRMLAQAQILADTFHGRWESGIPIVEAKAALGKLRELAAVPEYLLDHGVPEPVAAAASLMIRDEAQRELFLVIDVGAGTTDFGVFLLQHNPVKEICLVRTIPGTVEYLPQAGDRVDDLLKFYVLDSEGVDPASPEGRHNLAYLQNSIRLHKESMFRDGIVEVVLANHTRVVVEREAFLASDRVKAFTKQLDQKLAVVLSLVGDGYLDLMARGDLNVVLTGGGASLPMVMQMAKGLIEIKGRKILRRPSAQAPTWIEEDYRQFLVPYPQLAVAIGGATPDLPELGDSFADFKGIETQTYT